ncbi:MAG: hypothetical protein U1E76_02315 [Planctomycetota bacterium]
MPHEWWPQESAGFGLVIVYLFALPPLLAKTAFRKMLVQMDSRATTSWCCCSWSAMSLPLKMILRWTLNLKYIIAIPEFFFNI